MESLQTSIHCEYQESVCFALLLLRTLKVFEIELNLDVLFRIGLFDHRLKKVSIKISWFCIQKLECLLSTFNI